MQLENMGQNQYLPSHNDLKLLNSITPVSRETIALLQIYVDLLVQWQKKTNLISNTTLPQIWRRHICDSAQCFTAVSDKNKWLDIGTGAGFPGVVIAILARENKKFQIHLVESNQKKIAFIRAVLHATKLDNPASVQKYADTKINLHAQRIESVTKPIRNVDVVVARAVTSLDELLRMSEPWLQKNAIGLFPKGREYRKEIAESGRLQGYDLIEHRSLVEKDSVLLEISRKT